MSQTPVTPGVFPREDQFADSSREIDSMMAEIDDIAGPRTLIIIAVASDDSHAAIRDRCREYNSETELSLPTRIRTLAQAAETRQRFSFIISPTISTLSLQIPSAFRKVAITACEKERRFLPFGTAQTVKELILEDDSTFCSIALAKWNERTMHINHELVMGPGVALELPDEEVMDGEPDPPPFELRTEQDVDAAARLIEEHISSTLAPSATPERNPALPWIAGLAGAVGGFGTGAGLLVSSVKIGMNGLFISAGPFGHVAMGSASFTGTIVAGASVTATGAAVGIGIAAAVYFIPWRKLFSWLFEKFHHFMSFLKSIWNKIKDGLRFLKEILSRILSLVRSLGSGFSGLRSVAHFMTGSGQNRPIQLA